MNTEGKDVSIKRLPNGNFKVIIRSAYHKNEMVLTEEQAREEGLI